MTQADSSENSSFPHTLKIESIDEVTKKVAVTIASEKVEQEYAVALERAQKTAHLKGFRPGKAPKHLIQKTYGPRLQYDVADRLIGQSLQEVIKGMTETVIGKPTIDLDSFEAGKAITYTAQLEIWPEPSVSGYQSLEISVPKGEVADAEVDKVVKKFLESKANIEPVENRSEVKLGDVVDAELIELKNGEVSGASEPFVVPVGDNMLPAEIEQALIGMQVGGTKDIFLALGKHQTNDAKDDAAPNYRLQVKSIKIRILPEITDDLIKTAEIPGIQTVLEFKNDVRKKLEEEMEQQQQENINMAIVEKLVAANSFKVPNTLIDDEIKNMVASIGGTRERQIDPNKLNPEPFRKAFGEQAEKRVRSTILIDRIAEVENLKADDAALDKHCEELAVKHNTELEKVKEIVAKGDAKISVLMSLTRDRTLAWLRDKSKVTFTEPETK